MVIFDMNNCFEYKGYHSKIEYDYESKTLFGIIDGIQDLVTFESNSSSDIESEFHAAVDDYLEFCSSMGKEPDKEYKGTFNVRISPDLHRRASIKAFQDNISLNQFVQKAIQNELRGRINNEYHIYCSLQNAFPNQNSYSDISFKQVSSIPTKSYMRS